MTFTLKHETTDNYYIRIDQDKGMTGFTVVASERVYVGDPVYRECKRNTYPTYEMACKRFNYLKREAKKGNL